jgi:hypothetical protein
VLRIRNVIVMGFLVLGAGACRSGNPYKMSEADRAAKPGTVAVHVINNNFADMDVYAVSEGLPTRLGTVTGNSNDTFYLDPSFFPTSTLRIVATPIGGNGRASSGQISVSPGQTIDFTIAPVMSQSSVMIR